jgi:hypothetical protein
MSTMNTYQNKLNCTDAQEEGGRHESSFSPIAAKSTGECEESFNSAANAVYFFFATPPLYLIVFVIIWLSP